MVFILWWMLAYLAIAAYLNLRTTTLFDSAAHIGRLVNNIITHHRWASTYDHISFSAHRMPLQPLWMAVLSYLFGYQAHILTFVTIASTQLIMFFSIKRYIQYRSSMISILLVVWTLSMPQWVLWCFHMGYEECFIIPALAWISCILIIPNRNNHDPSTSTACGFGCLGSLLYLCKGSLLPFSLLLPLLYFLRYRYTKHLLLQWIILGLAMLCWGSFNVKQSGSFRVGTSWRGANLLKAHHEQTLSLYPTFDLDAISRRPTSHPSWPDGIWTQSFSNEWTVNDYLYSQAIDYIRQNPMKTLQYPLGRRYLRVPQPRGSRMCFEASY